MSTDLIENEYKNTAIFGQFRVINYPKSDLDLEIVKFDPTNNVIYIGRSDNSSTIYLYGNVIQANTSTGWYGQLDENGLINQFTTDTTNFLNQFTGSSVSNYLNQFNY